MNSVQTSRVGGWAAILLLVGGGVGCSSSGPTGLDHSTFVQRADAVCARTDGDVRKLTAPVSTDPDSLIAAAHDVVTLQHREVVSLASLRPPSADRSKVAAWLELERRALTESEAIIVATKAEDRAGIDRATQRARALDDQARRLAREIGLHACAARS